MMSDVCWSFAEQIYLLTHSLAYLLEIANAVVVGCPGETDKRQGQPGGRYAAAPPSSSRGARRVGCDLRSRTEAFAAKHARSLCVVYVEPCVHRHSQPLGRQPKPNPDLG